MGLRLFAFLAILLLGFSLARAEEAATTSITDPEILYRTISKDLALDVEQMGQDLNLTPEQQKKFAIDWRKFLENPSAPNPLSILGQTGASIWPPAPLPAPRVFKSDELVRIQAPALKPETPHTIADLRTYGNNRLGPELAQAIRDKKVQVEIYGGSSESLAGEAAQGKRVLRRIPSLYEKWGIEKFLDITPGEKPTAILRIPPFTEYVKHYSEMVGTQGGQLKRAVVNKMDRRAFWDSYSSAVKRIYLQLRTKPEYVALGYAREWQQELTNPNSPWKIIRSTQPYPTNGIAGVSYTLQNKINPNLKHELLVLSNDQTIWGEGSKFIAQAVLEQKPKAVFFLGSAGSLEPTVRVYSVSVPKSFRSRNGKPVKLGNFLNRFAQAGREIQTPSLGEKVKINYNITHGTTNSPAEETQDFLTWALQSKIGTTDVETSLVAKAVSEYNSRTGDNVAFGAAHVITDMPATRTSDIQQHLDNIDPVAKSRAKLAAVHLVETAMAEDSAAPMIDVPAVKAVPLALTSGSTTAAAASAITDQDRIQAIHQLFPNVPLSQIDIINGQGKIEVDPENKFSYYIFTANPADPLGKTTLIPMSTSRFDRYNYATNEWWDAHKDEIELARKNHTPVPHQDPHEVQAYLGAKGLSTNPDVIIVDGKTAGTTRQPLKDFLLQDYIDRFSDGDHVMLYRGAERPGELEQWKQRIFPRGVRYWTPDANYAWRYGRKDPGFNQGLVEGTTPIFRYKIPKQEFIRLVKNDDLILGTEITRSAHNGFERGGHFTDALNGYDYMGDGKYGLDWEIRARTHGREIFPRYFDGAVTADELASVRMKRIRDSTARLSVQDPTRATELGKTAEARIQQIHNELAVIHALQKRESPDVVANLVNKIQGGRGELSSDMERLPSFALDYSKRYPSKPISATKLADPAALCVDKYSGVAGSIAH